MSSQLQEECPGVDLRIRPPGVPISQAVVRAIRSAGIGRLAVEADSMTVGQRDRIAEKLPKLAIGAVAGLVEKLRQVKDKEEIAAIREANWYAEKAFGGAGHDAARADGKGSGRRTGPPTPAVWGRGCGFPPIVAAGPRAALPHAKPTAATLDQADFVLIDWGADGGSTTAT